MSDPETFLLEVYVLVDDLVTTLPAATVIRPGPAPALSVSETITLAVMSQWARFRSERDFYRYADACLRPLFPTLPSRPQYNRQVRRWGPVIAEVGAALGQELAHADAYEVIDATAVPVRNAKRRGPGWLAGLVDISWSNRLGWYEGVHLLTCAGASGVLTGLGAGPATTQDRSLAETFFALRGHRPAVLPSVGQSLGQPYLADMGFGGHACEQRWRTTYGVTVICPPQPDRRTRQWSTDLRHWLVRHRQIIEAVHARLMSAFRLDANRPHTLSGLLAMLAATFAAHNIAIWLNRRYHRPDLTVVGVLDW